MCDVFFWGVPGCVTKCDRGGGSKLAKNSVTYFMDDHTPGRYLPLNVLGLNRQAPQAHCL